MLPLPGTASRRPREVAMSVRRALGRSAVVLGARRCPSPRAMPCHPCVAEALLRRRVCRAMPAAVRGSESHNEEFLGRRGGAGGMPVAAVPPPLPRSGTGRPGRGSCPAGSAARSVRQLDSADAYAQPALLYCMSSAGMAKDHIHGHSTYYHVTIMLHHLFQLYILRLNIVAFFYLHARSL